MADIIAEINTIGDVISPSSEFTRLYKQEFPEKYVANTVGIRWQGDDDSDYTQAAFAINRIYQVVYFGNTEVDCLRKINLIRSAITGARKLQIRESDEFISFDSFNFTPPFKTDTDGVYAVSSVLTTTVREAFPQTEYEKMAEINADINEGGI